MGLNGAWFCHISLSTAHSFCNNFGPNCYSYIYCHVCRWNCQGRGHVITPSSEVMLESNLPFPPLFFVPAVPLPRPFCPFFHHQWRRQGHEAEAKDLTLKAKTKDSKIVLEDEELSFWTPTLSITMPSIPYRCLPQAACVTAPPRSASLINYIFVSAPLHWRTQGAGVWRGIQPPHRIFWIF